MEWMEYLLKSSGILTLFYLLYQFALRKDTLFQANRRFLLVGLIAAVALPWVQFSKVVYVDAPLRTMISSEIATQTTLLEGTTPAPTFEVWQLLLLAYALGVLVMIFRFGLQVSSLFRLLRKYPKQRKNGYTFVRVDLEVSPFSYFRYIVFNPNFHSEAELEMILKHERVHVSQWHSIDILSAQLLRAFQWLNPFAWLYKSSIEQNLEYIADSETATHFPSLKQYQLTLVKASSSLYPPAITNPFYQSFIKKRIIMLNKNHSNRKNLWKLSLILPLLAVFLWSFNVEEVVHYRDLGESPNPTVSKPLTSSIETPISEVKNPVEINLERQSEKPEKQAALTLTKNSQPVQEKVLDIAETPTKQTTRELIKFEHLINKNTTDAELDRIKAELRKTHDIDMSYEVVRNSNGEITSISLQYSGNGSSGNYNISEDDGIDPFYFFQDEDGQTGFWSEARESRLLERQARRMARVEEREGQLKERMLEREERRGELAERRVERDYKLARTKERLAERDKELAERNEKLLERSKELYERRDRNLATVYRTRRGQGVRVYSDNTGMHSKAIVIDKDTTDSDLASMKEKLSSQGITFTYSKVKRNSSGEIVRIKIVTDNGKGNKSTIVTQADDGEPIDEILIDL